MKTANGVLVVVLMLGMCFPCFAAEKKSIRAAGGAIMSGMPIWANDQNGAYKKADLDVQYHIFPSGAAVLESFSAKQFDVAIASAIPGVLSGSRLDSIIIGIPCEESDVNSSYVHPDSPLLKTKGAIPGYPEIYGTPDDWRGKKVLCTTLSGGHYALLKTLNALGLTEKDITLVQIEQGQALAAFNAKQGDIVQLWSPGSYIGESKGWVRVSSGKFAKANIPSCILVNRKFAEENQETVVAWLDLYMRIVDQMRADKKYATDLLHTFYTGYCSLSMEKSIVEVDYPRRGYFNLEEQIDALTDPSKMQSWMAATADFLAAEKRITEKELQKFKSLGCTVEPKFMKMVAEKRAREAATQKAQ